MWQAETFCFEGEQSDEQGSGVPRESLHNRGFPIMENRSQR